MDKKTNTEKIRASYQFFLEMQEKRMLFSSEDISRATGWSKSTIKTYRSKKWADILISKSNRMFMANLKAYTEDAYVRMMSQNYKQSIDPFRPELPECVEELVVKARDCAILAIDIYNRPIVAFRSQGYIVLMIIAWASLFHAIYEHNDDDYFYKDKQGNPILIDGDKKAWELDRCIDKCGNMISEAVKQNLRLFILLRNKIEHRYVPAFDLDIFGECQAMLLNFETLLTDKFGTYYALNNTLSFPLQISSTRNHEQTKALKKVESKHYLELKNYIDSYRTSLEDAVYADNQYSFRIFLVPQVGNHKNSSDCAIEFIRYDPKHPEEFDAIKRNIALIREKRVPVANQGKLKPKMVCDKLSKRLGITVNLTLHTSAWKYYGVRKSGKQDDCKVDYCQFDEAHRDYVYTQAWVDFLAERLSDPVELEKVRNFR